MAETIIQQVLACKKAESNKTMKNSFVVIEGKAENVFQYGLQHYRICNYFAIHLFVLMAQFSLIRHSTVGNFNILRSTVSFMVLFALQWLPRGKFNFYVNPTRSTSSPSTLDCDCASPETFTVPIATIQCICCAYAIICDSSAS